ncbi:hypothetical protein PVAG01_10607 [Phlyctema vagabunda]|uniref:Uncharacterized protein n=1 Tax=Phlyctema vagabunda TaxID=108571 RepID=A0ABR4P2S3_9HELO
MAPPSLLDLEIDETATQQASEIHRPSFTSFLNLSSPFHSSFSFTSSRSSSIANSHAYSPLPSPSRSSMIFTPYKSTIAWWAHNSGPSSMSDEARKMFDPDDELHETRCERDRERRRIQLLWQLLALALLLVSLSVLVGVCLVRE